MIPIKSFVQLDRTCHVPIYLQITNGIICAIQNGVLKAGTKLPGSRLTAELFDVHRKTIVKAYEELEAQGWIEIIPYKGTFVAQHLPQVKVRSFVVPNSTLNTPSPSMLSIPIHPVLELPSIDRYRLGFDDGAPDVRLAPVNEMAKAYASILRKIPAKKFLGYVDTVGLLQLREQLADNLNRNRGLNINASNVMITRGSQMGIYMVAATLLQKGDQIIVGETNYPTSSITFQYVGAQLIRIPVDDHGLVVDAIEPLCKKHKIKAIFVTSHHHHPTTVTLCPERRIKLLALAERFNFAIIEDDYDYNFHYANSPVLPLASADKNGLVTYIGSFSKTTAPAFRIGYIITSTPMIKELSKLRRLLDRQGDPVLEMAFSELLEAGIIRRYLKKSLKKYKERRDLMAELLVDAFGNKIHFKIPDGGMAIWVQFDQKINLPALSQLALAQNLYLPNGLSHDLPGKKLNACRMGFASRNLEEIKESITLLKKVYTLYLKD